MLNLKWLTVNALSRFRRGFEIDPGAAAHKPLRARLEMPSNITATCKPPCLEADECDVDPCLG